MDLPGINTKVVRIIRKAGIIILLLFFSTSAISQVALVVKNKHSGGEWAFRKGKTLTVANWGPNHDSVHYKMTGRLVFLTDSSLTLRNEHFNYTETFLFRDVDEVEVVQSGAGKFISYGSMGTGIVMIVYSPFAGNFSDFMISLGSGIVVTGFGLLTALPYMNTYSVSGTCKTGNEIYLRNSNGNYFFSFATGMGDSYGGLGFRAQARFGGIMGVGVHVGAGWVFPYASDDPDLYVFEDAVSVMTGIKFFPYRGWYLDLQFGNFGKIAHATYKGEQILLSDIRTPYGFVFTGGGDWFFGRTYGLNLGFGMALDLTAPKSSQIMPALDMGFIVKLGGTYRKVRNAGM